MIPTERGCKNTLMNGRWAAFQAVRAVLRGAGFVQETLGRLRGQGLAGREAGLAMEIALGAVRRLITIEHVLSRAARYDSRRVNSEMRAILAIGAYQVIWLDRIPEFAAVDETVELTRRALNQRAAGMANAILRNLTRAIEARGIEWERLNSRHVRTDWRRACLFREPVLPDPNADKHSAAHLAAATGLRRPRYAALVKQYGAQRAEAVAWAQQAAPVTVIHRNALRIDAGIFQDRIQRELGDEAEWTPDGVFVPADANVLDTPLFQEGRAYVQDMTARAAALLLDVRPGERILDFCAAPGGKSIVLAECLLDRGEILACDASPDRIQHLAENIRRLRLTSVRAHLLQTSDASDADLQREFDAALVDVPCSNSGVFARRPEARLGFTREKLDSLCELQAVLLRKTASCVRPGGRLVYSTCSIEPDENERIVEAFLHEQPQWRQLLARLTLPEWGPKPSDWRDGGFAALLVRQEG